MVYLPIISAIALAGGTIYDRFILKFRKLDVKTYQVYSFLALTLVMIPLLFFFWGVKPQALEIKNILIFLFVIVIAIVANFIAYYSIKGDKLNNTESARVLEPLFVIVLAIAFSFIFGTELYERNYKIIIPALIAGAVLVFSQLKRGKIIFNKFYVAAIIGSVLFSLELVLSQLILQDYSPMSFYFIRCFFIFLFSFMIFRKDIKKIKDSKTKWDIFFVSLIWVTYRVAIYYGYIYSGVIKTTLILMLSPILVYLFAYFFLKEKLNWRNIFASIVIILCIVYATIDLSKVFAFFG